MFLFDKENELTEYCDIRTHYEELITGHIINVKPTTQADFRNLPFDDNSFNLVVFDPPHLVQAGKNSWLAKKYGTLSKETWANDISKGFDEAMRVLKPFGTLVFKWNEEQITLQQILKAIKYKPLFGNKRNKTHWVVFMKIVNDGKE